MHQKQIKHMSSHSKLSQTFNVFMWSEKLTFLNATMIGKLSVVNAQSAASYDHYC